MADEEEDPDHIDLFTCELCDCSQVRFVHVMRHDEYFETVSVGCICAGIMEGDNRVLFVCCNGKANAPVP